MPIIGNCIHSMSKQRFSRRLYAANGACKAAVATLPTGWFALPQLHAQFCYRGNQVSAVSWDGSVIIISFGHTFAGSHPCCYEVHVDAPGHKVPVLSFRCAATRSGKGDTICSLVPMRHADNAISIREGKPLSFGLVQAPAGQTFMVRTVAKSSQLAQQCHAHLQSGGPVVVAWSCSEVQFSVNM